MGLCAIVLLVFMSLGLRADAGDYLALVPSNIHSGDDATIPVKILDLGPAEYETVTAQLIEKVKDDEKVLTSVVEQATAGKPDILLKLEVPASVTQSWPYQYFVRVIGSGAFKFSNDTRVYVQRPRFPVFVQMDKPVYKPGDMVKYRVFAIGENLDQIFMKFTLHIFTPKGQKIEEVNNADAKPVYQDELPLADETLFGRWRIEIIPKAITFRKSSKTEKVANKGKINDKKAKCDSKDKEKCYDKLLKFINKNSEVETDLEDPETITDKNILSSMKTSFYFKVEEYVLPNVFVNLEMQSYYIIGDKFLTGKLIAKYPTNRPVEAYAEIRIGKRYMYGFFGPKAVSMSQQIAGTWEFSIPKAVLDRLTGCSKSTTLRVHANVIETVTSIKYEADPVDVRFYELPYKIEFHKRMPENFMPGFRYDVDVMVSKQDGSLAVDVEGKVAITATYFAKTSFNVTPQVYPNEISFDGFDFESPFEQGFTGMFETKEYKIENGVARIKDLFVPDAAATGTIQAEFACQCITKEISRFNTQNQGFLRVEAIEVGELAVGGRVVLRIRFSFANIDGNYLIISKNKIVGFGSFHIGSAKFVTIFPLLTRDMAPSARVVVYTVYKDELVVDGINLAVEDMYENKVLPAFIPSGEVKPQSDVTLTVTADPYSLACVLLQDSRVRELGVDNDITQERVERALGGSYFSPIYRRCLGRCWPWRTTADDSWDKLKDASLVPLTSLVIFRNILRADEPVRKAKKKMASKQSARSEQAEGLVRQNFPETWKWQCLQVGKSGKVEIQSLVPDTITKWQANAFALNAKSGLGVAPRTADLIGNLKFYVKVELPYSVVQNELIILSPLVFNDLDEDLNVRVTFFNTDGEFQGVELDEDGKPTNINGDITRCILAKAKSVTPVFFHFIPLIANSNMKVDVKIEELKSQNIFDEVIKYLTVKAEGKEMTGNEVFLISHQTDSTTSKSVDITYPANTVKGSERMRITVIGDLFGATLKNIDRLLRMPYGCGEQNLINFVPAVMVLRYLDTTGRLTLELREKIRRIIITGYQRQLLYLRPDGSFSAFGKADSAGSLWLTALVAKAFANTFEVATNINVVIDPDVVDVAVSYIIKNQEEDGHFKEKGRVIHKRMQGGTIASKATLAAFVVNALEDVKHSNILAGRETNNDVDTAIALARKYLNDVFSPNINDYEAAITALAYPDDPRTFDALEASENKTIVDGMMYWRHQGTWRWTLQIETAAYALMVYTRQNSEDSLVTAIMILKWLIKQRTPYGGFRSTQDTMVALQALEEIAEKIYAAQVDMQIQVIAKTEGTEVADESFTLNKENHDVLQLKDLPDKVDKVEVHAEGQGLALVEVHVFYNVKEEEVPPSYKLSVQTLDESLKEYKVRACARYLNTNEASGMAVLIIPAVTGYEPTTDGISAESIKRVDVKDETVIIYFDEISSTDDVCVLVVIKRVFPAAAWKEATVQVYTYYEPDENAMVNYIPKILKNMNVCKVCGEECGCGKDSKVLPMAKCISKKK